MVIALVDLYVGLLKPRNRILNLLAPGPVLHSALKPAPLNPRHSPTLEIN